MKRKECKRVEAALPARYRGRGGYKRMLESMTLRVSVTGIRGKSALTAMTSQVLRERGLSVYAKQTGTVPKSIKDGVESVIERDPRRPTVLDETYWEVKKHYPFEAMVLENQAITPYTMKTFNDLYCRPHYVLLTNIRRDHQGDIARRTDQMARHFVRSIPIGATLVSGERDPSLKVVMMEESKKRRVKFIDASPGRLVVPGYESLTILDAFLKDWMGEGITRDEMVTELRRLERIFRWQPSAFPDVRWFHGAEINDVDSTKVVLDHLRRHEAVPVHFVAYMRRDRPDRTASFLPFLRAQLRSGTAASVTLVGHRVNKLARRLHPWRDQVRVMRDNPKTPAQLAQRLAREARGEAVMTIANAVPPWPNTFAQQMRAGVTPAPVARAKEHRLARAVRAPSA